MHCIFCQFEWNLVAFSYHSFKVVGGFSQVITCFWSGVGSIFLKKSMMAIKSDRPDQVTSILNLATCSSILLLLAILSHFISSRASPGPSKGSNDFLIISFTSLKVPSFKSVSFFSASSIFLAVMISPGSPVLLFFLFHMLYSPFSLFHYLFHVDRFTLTDAAPRAALINLQHSFY